MQTVPASRIRLVCVTPQHNKFYDIYTVGATSFVNFGRIGSEGNGAWGPLPDRTTEATERAKLAKGYTQRNPVRLETGSVTLEDHQISAAGALQARAVSFQRVGQAITWAPTVIPDPGSPWPAPVLNYVDTALVEKILSSEDFVLTSLSDTTLLPITLLVGEGPEKWCVVGLKGKDANSTVLVDIQGAVVLDDSKNIVSNQSLEQLPYKVRFSLLQKLHTSYTCLSLLNKSLESKVQTIRKAAQTSAPVVAASLSGTPTDTFYVIKT